MLHNENVKWSVNETLNSQDIKGGVIMKIYAINPMNRYKSTYSGYQKAAPIAFRGGNKNETSDTVVFEKNPKIYTDKEIDELVLSSIYKL